ncbi:MAG: ferritin-like domain-containing protein [Anaerolineae bacterium]|nr:ferritin-like domain-containing protein [Anaerolineae bacterium]
MNHNTLKDVYVGQLKDVYSAEKQLTEALPQMAQAASNQKLRQAFENHLTETENHMQAVRTILDDLNENPTSTKCKAMAGLIEEGSEIVQNGGDADARDAALIVAAQKVEHYEIATYGSLRTFANSLGYDEAAEVLQSILNQEYAADQTLDDIAMGTYNRTGLNVAAKN